MDRRFRQFEIRKRIFQTVLPKLPPFSSFPAGVPYGRHSMITSEQQRAAYFHQIPTQSDRMAQTIPALFLLNFQPNSLFASGKPHVFIYNFVFIFLFRSERATLFENPRGEPPERNEKNLSTPGVPDGPESSSASSAMWHRTVVDLKTVLSGSGCCRSQNAPLSVADRYPVSQLEGFEDATWPQCALREGVDARRRRLRRRRCTCSTQFTFIIPLFIRFYSFYSLFPFLLLDSDAGVSCGELVRFVVLVFGFGGLFFFFFVCLHGHTAHSLSPPAV